MRPCLLVVLCACRIGFDARGDASDANDAQDASITTITFGERPTSLRRGVTRDATVGQMMANANFGGAEDLSVAEFIGNGEHALLYFDLTSIAPGTRVVAARLSLVRLDYGDETPGPVEVRLLGESWTEGTGSGMPGPGATWATRDGAMAWATPGGSTTRTLTTVTPGSTDVVIALDSAVAQGWIDDAATNAGVLLTVGVNTAHYHFHARNSTMNGNMARPELALDLAN